MKAWLSQWSQICPKCEITRRQRPMRALVSITLQRNLHNNTCAEQDFWAIRRSQPIQVDRLVSYPLVFIHIRIWERNELYILIQILLFHDENQGSKSAGDWSPRILLRFPQTSTGSPKVYWFLYTTPLSSFWKCNWAPWKKILILSPGNTSRYRFLTILEGID